MYLTIWPPRGLGNDSSEGNEHISLSGLFGAWVLIAQ